MSAQRKSVLFSGIFSIVVLVPAVKAKGDPVTLPDTTVTATLTERETFDVPQAVSVIDQNYIATSLQSMTPDLFRYSPGIYIQKTNQGGGSPFIRGLTGKQVLILVDGIRLNNSFYRFGPHQYLNTIDPNLIERIETVRGPSSVLYGTDALGGTINVITRKRGDFSRPSDLGGLLSVHFESASEAGLYRGQVEGNQGDLGFIVGATGKNYGHLEAGGDIGKQIPGAYDEVDADLKLNYRLGDNRELVFAWQYTRQFDVPKTSEVTLGDKLKFNYEPQKRNFGYLEFRSGAMGFFDGVRFNVSYNNQQEGERIISRSSPSVETHEITDVQTAGLNLQFKNILWKDHQLSYGFEYYHDDYQTKKLRRDRLAGTNSRLPATTPDGASYQSWALFLQDEAQWLESLKGVFGIRYNQYDAEGEIGTQRLAFETDALAGNMNLQYHLTSYLSLVGGLAWGFRAPNMEDFFGRVDFFSEIPNTSLKPEEAFNKEIGLKFRLDGLAAEAFYFHSDYQGFIDRKTVGFQANGTPVQQRQNVNRAIIEGVEMGLEYWLNDAWLAAGTLTWTEGRDDKGQALRRIPPVNGAARVRYYPLDQLWVEASVLWAANQDRLAKGDIEDLRIGPGGTPGYTVYGVKAGFTPHRQHEILVELENLGDKVYKTHGSGIFAAGLSVLATYRFRF